jgi:hypothetical protein
VENSVEDDAPKKNDHAFSCLVVAANGAMENSVEDDAPKKTIMHFHALLWPRTGPWRTPLKMTLNQSRDGYGAVVTRPPLPDGRGSDWGSLFIAIGGPKDHGTDRPPGLSYLRPRGGPPGPRRSPPRGGPPRPSRRGPRSPLPPRSSRRGSGGRGGSARLGMPAG